MIIIDSVWFPAAALTAVLVLAAVYVWFEVRTRRIEHIYQEVHDACYRFNMEKVTEFNGFHHVDKLPPSRTMLYSFKPLKLRNFVPLAHFQELIDYINDKSII